MDQREKNAEKMRKYRAKKKGDPDFIKKQRMYSNKKYDREKASKSKAEMRAKWRQAKQVQRWRKAEDKENLEPLPRSGGMRRSMRLSAKEPLETIPVETVYLDPTTALDLRLGSVEPHQATTCNAENMPNDDSWLPLSPSFLLHGNPITPKTEIDQDIEIGTNETSWASPSNPRIKQNDGCSLISGSSSPLNCLLLQPSNSPLHNSDFNSTERNQASLIVTGEAPLATNGLNKPNEIGSSSSPSNSPHYNSDFNSTERNQASLIVTGEAPLATNRVNKPNEIGSSSSPSNSPLYNSDFNSTERNQDVDVTSWTPNSPLISLFSDYGDDNLIISETIKDTLVPTRTNSSSSLDIRTSSGLVENSFASKVDGNVRRSSRPKNISAGVKHFLANGGKRPKRKSVSIPQTQAGTPPPTTKLKKRISTIEKERKNLARQAKCYRDNKKLREQNARLKKLLDKFKKRYNRLLNKTKEKNKYSELDKWIKDPLIPKEVKTKLVEHNVLEQQLTNTYNCTKGYKEKDHLRKIFMSGKVGRQYRKLSYLKKFAPKRGRKGGSKISLSQLKRQQISEDIRNFLEEDKNSQMTAGTKETITRGKMKKQIRYLRGSLLELHKEFLKTSKFRISYTVFCRLKPFWVIAPKHDKSNTCLCKVHENFEYLLKKLHTEKVLEDSSSSNFVRSITCEASNISCMLRECEICQTKSPKFSEAVDIAKKVTYNQWTTKSEEYSEKKQGPDGKIIFETSTKQTTVLDEISGELGDVMALLVRKTSDYLRHVFFMNHQNDVLKEKRLSLDPHEMHLWVDFAENWSTRMPKEIQKMHFAGNRKQFSFHTSVGYTQAGYESMCSVSSNRDHSPPEIMAHLQPVVSYLLGKIEPPHKLSFQSDSPTNQYRGKDMFAYLAQVLPTLFPSVTSFTWNYTEAGHGKGPVDGVGAAVKSKANWEVNHGENIDTFEKFVTCSKKLENVKIFVINQEDILTMHNQSINSRTFKGTMQTHQVTWSRSSPTQLYFNKLSCFQCMPGTKCQHFHLGILEYQRPTAQPLVQSAIEAESVDNPDPRPNEAELGPIEKDSWVVLALSGQPYPGKVLKILKDKVTVKVMMRNETGSKYSWPKITDRRTLKMDQVKRIPEPKEVEESFYVMLQN